MSLLTEVYSAPVAKINALAQSQHHIAKEVTVSKMLKMLPEDEKIMQGDAREREEFALLGGKLGPGSRGAVLAMLRIEYSI